MATVRSQLPYRDLPEDQLTRIQGAVSLKDKRAVITALGDDGALTIVLQYAFYHAANFIRTNNIVAFDDDSHTRFITFLRDGAVARAPQAPDAHDVGGGAKGVQRKDADATRKSVRDAEVGQGRSGSKVKRPQEE